ncbi:MULTISPECIES: ABC transporter permease subunit [Kitasatospora]|uniref:Putative osmoprotectant ABC transporter permease protein n=1 Tax=Kitasatospora setae (strain ATCC 33774 / DSM 43861 / JCM 3304 / KCC A-0304 / NBRC 14216 / KM-6054) TaxID=452652 RepID=E4N1C4_KITSK|nr:ABC transporter permease subunit [Kitasatospora setae]BAJ31958.1 putative osmoprotectant ABC transporter permease protein [Kitasatospora setae KM-6054]
MNWLGWLHDFFADPAHHSGPDSIAHRVLEHLAFSAEALGLAALVALPLGLLIGYSGRGLFVVTALAGVARALPTLGLVTLAVLLVGVGDAAVLLPLTALAAPPMLVAAAEGVRGTVPDVRDAARGIGLTHPQTLLRVCVPAAAPTLLAGVRTAAVQVIATATVAAYVGLGGLGRYVIDGLATRNFPTTVGGALLVVLLAVAVQLLFALLIRLASPPGSRTGTGAGTGRRRNRDATPEPPAAPEPTAEPAVLDDPAGSPALAKEST